MGYPCRSPEPVCKSAGSDFEHSVRYLTEAVKGLQQQDLSRGSDLLPKLLIDVQDELDRLSAACRGTSLGQSSERSTVASSGWSSTCAPTLDSLSTWPSVPCSSDDKSRTPDFGIGIKRASPCPTSRDLLCHSVDRAIPDPPLSLLPCLSSSLPPVSRSKSCLAEKPSPQCPKFSTKGFIVAKPVHEEDASSDPWELHFLSLAQSS